MSKPSENTKYYFEEQASDLTPSILERIATYKEDEIWIWVDGKREDYDVFFPISGPNEHGAIPVSFKSTLITKLTGPKSLDKNCYFKYNGHGVYYFIHGQLVKGDDGEYLFIPKSNVYKCQQRANLRIKAGPHNTIQVKINDEVRDGLDISAGGTCFIADKEVAEQFNKDDTFKECVIRFNGQNFDIPTMRIAGKWPYVDGLGNQTNQEKVGIAFADMSQNLEQELTRFIHLEARAEEIRQRLLKESEEKKAS